MLGYLAWVPGGDPEDGDDACFPIAATSLEEATALANTDPLIDRTANNAETEIKVDRIMMWDADMADFDKAHVLVTTNREDAIVLRECYVDWPGADNCDGCNKANVGGFFPTCSVCFYCPECHDSNRCAE